MNARGIYNTPSWCFRSYSWPRFSSHASLGFLLSDVSSARLPKEEASPTFFRNETRSSKPDSVTRVSSHYSRSLSPSIELELIEPTLTLAKSVPSSLHYYGSAPGPFFPRRQRSRLPFLSRSKGRDSPGRALPILLHRSLSRWREVPDFCPIKKFNLEVSK